MFLLWGSDLGCLYFFRVTMMMWFCPAASTTAKTRQKTSCLVRGVCNTDYSFTACMLVSLHMQTVSNSYYPNTSSYTDGTVRLQREVVLLTDDRNLRVKALTRNVPVRDIPAFLSWAKVGWTGINGNQRNPAMKPACNQATEGRHREDTLKQRKERRRWQGKGNNEVENHFSEIQANVVKAEWF